MSVFTWTPADKQTDLVDDDELEDYNKPENVSHLRVFQHDFKLKATSRYPDTHSQSKGGSSVNRKRAVFLVENCQRHRKWSCVNPAFPDNVDVVRLALRLATANGSFMS